jgi:glycosyltransferase involved in cell wall biosynthesis
VLDLVPQDESIGVVHLEDVLPIGEKRNFGCQYAHGDVICHWDDDDYSAPERLADQMCRLAESGKAVTGYHSMRFTDGAKWWQYRGERHYALGTSLCYRRAWWDAHRFPAIQIGEDNGFVETAWRAGELATVDGTQFMHATIHAANTSPRMLGSNWVPL